MSKLKLWVVIVLLGTIHSSLTAQELYVFSDPASNVPAKSLSLKYGGKFMGDDQRPSGDVIMSRHMLDASFGLNKKWMIRPAFTFSDMYTNSVMRWESLSLYAKYRFLSNDAVHKHFRAAAFMKGVYSRNNLRYEELTGDGDQSVLQAGLILTQLVDKLAISSTLALTEVVDGERFLKYGGARRFGYSSFNYSLSSGYLLFPRRYKSYEQTNFNIYLELIGSQALDRKVYFVDLAPALQFIVNSNTKINVGYRFQLKGNAFRMADANPSLSLSVERTFFNTFKK
ncbi:MAG: hypothetical protein RL642_29 [Bacteroidota bacterium]